MSTTQPSFPSVTTGTVPGGPPSRLALAAASWSGVFLAMHVAWASGWEPLFPSGQRDEAFAHPLFVAYNGLAIVLCAIGVLAPALMGRSRLARRVATVGLGILVVRGIIGLAIGLILGRSVGYDVWFLLGATIFAGALRR